MGFQRKRCYHNYVPLFHCCQWSCVDRSAAEMRKKIIASGGKAGTMSKIGQQQCEACLYKKQSHAARAAFYKRYLNLTAVMTKVRRYLSAGLFSELISPSVLWMRYSSSRLNYQVQCPDFKTDDGDAFGEYRLSNQVVAPLPFFYSCNGTDRM